MDIAGLDAVVVAGFPGTRASFWQQAGRAGRGRDEALVVLVARDDPLDTYLVHHPDALLGAPGGGLRARPRQPVRARPAPGLRRGRAAADRGGRRRRSAAPAAEAVLAELVADGVLRRRPAGWFWPSSADRPAGSVDMRGRRAAGRWRWSRPTPGGCSARSTAASAPATVHPGAVYLHRGESYVVDDLDLDAGLALVHAAAPDWRTDARSTADVAVVRVTEHRDHGAVRVSFGEVSVTTQVTAYQRRTPDGIVLETVPLDMPAQTLATRAVWYDLDDGALLGAGSAAARIPGALHAAEHAAIGLLPLFATCDRWDIGGMSTAVHPHTGCPTVFVHDGHPGGAGFAERGHAVLRAVAGGDPGGDRRLRVPGRLPVVRAVAQVRQRQRPAGQGGRGDGARRGARAP